MLKELGFDDISSDIFRIDEALLVNNVNRLSELNSKFDSISPNMKLNINRGTKTFGRVNWLWEHQGSTDLTLSRVYFDSSIIRQYTREQIENGWWMPVSDDYLDVSLITHEYGHMLQTNLIINSDFVDSVRSIRGVGFIERRHEYGRNRYRQESEAMRQEIISIANELHPNIDVTQSISQYGMKNSDEFFAECFMNSQCGQPNELGEAMNEWLRRRGYVI